MIESFFLSRRVRLSVDADAGVKLLVSALCNRFYNGESW